MKAKIISTGGYYPQYKINNQDLVDTFGIDEWLLEQLGIKHRYWATNPETLFLEETQADMLEKASKIALENGKTQAEDIDLLIVSSTVSDYTLPTTATILQEKLKINDCNAIEIHSGCVGAIQALDFALSQILTGKIKKALVSTSNLMSTYWSRDIQNQDVESIDDQLNIAMFSDSASAVVVEASNENGIECVFAGSNGADIPKGIFLEMGGAVYPGSYSNIQEGLHKWKQKTKLIRKHGSNLSKIALEKIQKLTNSKPEEIDFFIFPQANPSLLESDMDRLKNVGFPTDRVISIVHEQGNSATASLFHVLDKLYTDQKLSNGTRVAIIGGEASKWLYGGVLLKW
ncbi:3-oxoacyl-ACP synthase III family protein [Paraliobacillus sp. JSM ZJ581]|uniref:3-oxoacyl-ACP synthase III family protein n=1 Tax=Paraliobacillus sp. JSM ZJ581 TaxID=3342118 RepID=UPI0035A96900